VCPPWTRRCLPRCRRPECCRAGPSARVRRAPGRRCGRRSPGSPRRPPSAGRTGSARPRRVSPTPGRHRCGASAPHRPGPLRGPFAARRLLLGRRPSLRRTCRGTWRSIPRSHGVGRGRSRWRSRRTTAWRRCGRSRRAAIRSSCRPSRRAGRSCGRWVRRRPGRHCCSHRSSGRIGRTHRRGIPRSSRSPSRSASGRTARSDPARGWASCATCRRRPSSTRSSATPSGTARSLSAPQMRTRGTARTARRSNRSRPGGGCVPSAAPHAWASRGRSRASRCTAGPRRPSASGSASGSGRRTLTAGRSLRRRSGPAGR
jgi:hypothetical protein